MVHTVVDIPRSFGQTNFDINVRSLSRSELFSVHGVGHKEKSETRRILAEPLVIRKVETLSTIFFCA